MWKELNIRNNMALGLKNSGWPTAFVDLLVNACALPRASAWEYPIADYVKKQCRNIFHMGKLLKNNLTTIKLYQFLQLYDIVVCK